MNDFKKMSEERMLCKEILSYVFVLFMQHNLPINIRVSFGNDSTLAMVKVEYEEMDELLVQWIFDKAEKLYDCNNNDEEI